MSLEKRVEALEKEKASSTEIVFTVTKSGEPHEEYIDYQPDESYERVFVIGKGWRYCKR